MAKLISIVGNTGVGKTTLVRQIGLKSGYIASFEGHVERPFQALFKESPDFALANQVDYLLVRTEQEKALREGTGIGIMDGGLEMDFHVFSRLFLLKGWLNKEEFGLLERLFRTVRSFLPPPDLIISLYADPSVIASRYYQRDRPIEIATREDQQVIAALILEMLNEIETKRIISIDVSDNDPSYRDLLPGLMDEIQRRLDAI